MKTSVEALSEVELKVEVEVEADKVNREYAKQLSKLGKRARIKGFRPGKAPKALIRKHFGSSASAEATRQLINDTLGEVLDGLERQPIGYPMVEPGVARENEPLKYAVRVQVKPQIEIHSWSGIEVAVAPAVADPAEVEQRIGAMRNRLKERVPVEGRGADTGDILICNIEGSLDGERDPRLDAKDIEIKIGAGRMIPGFEDQLMGAEVGTLTEVESGFPDDYHAADLAGKTGSWSVEVLQHLVEETPALDDDFAKDEGFDNVAALRADVTAKVLADAEQKRADEIETKVIGVLLERNQFKAPPELVEAHARDRAGQMMQLLQMQGADQETAVGIIKSNAQGLTEAAERAIRRHLALESFAQQQGLDVEEEELAAEIVKRIEEHGEQVAKRYEDPEVRETLRAELTQKRALATIVGKARVVDETPEATEDDDSASASDEASLS
ncbi:MAG: trigger factor [Deltaproteobacteria bacterium]|nr:MAG: trigger factor [Deltaproteobacteria bacterium]